jgi:hypothetical protein
MNEKDLDCRYPARRIEKTGVLARSFLRLRLRLRLRLALYRTCVLVKYE